MLALPGRDIHFRFPADRNCAGSRASTSKDPARNQSLSWRGVDRGQGSILYRLCRSAPCGAPDFHHAEHGSNGPDAAYRASDHFYPEKLGVGMTAIAADHAPAVLEVAGLSKRYGDQRALAEVSFD